MRPSIYPKGISWLLIMSIMIMVFPMLILADGSTAAVDIEKIKQLRQLQNQGSVLKNLKANSIATKASAEQERMLRLSKALSQITATPDMESSPRLDLRRDDRATAQPQNSGIRDVYYNSGRLHMGYLDSTYFNFLTGMNSADTLGMDIMIIGNEGAHIGNETALNFGADYSPLLYLEESGSLADFNAVPAVDDPSAHWIETTYDFQYGTLGTFLSAGSVWAVYTRTEGMYVILEVTGVDSDWSNGWSNGWINFDYMIQTDGTPLFDDDPSLFDITVNGDEEVSLEIGSNPYVEITLDGHMYGEFSVIWDGNHNGLLDDSDFGLEIYDFMDNDMHDEDMTDGIFGFTYSDEMADGLNYLADDLLFVASADMDLAVAPVHFYTLPSPFSVSGTIYDGNAAGDPLENIVVWASFEGIDDNDGPSVIVLTDALGQYHIDLPDTGWVIVGSEDHFEATEDLLPDPPHHMLNVQGAETGYDFFYVAPASAIEGHVLDEMGTAIEGVEISAHMGDGPGRQAVTDANGFYSMGVMLGEYDVEINWESLPGAYLIPGSEHVYVGDFAVTIVDFTLHTTNNMITGTVLLDGLPLIDALVVGMTMDLGYTVTMSGDDGAFELPVFGGPERFYNLMVFFPDDMEGVMQVSDNFDVPAGTTGEMILLETLTGGLYGYFINGETGEPIMDGYDMGMSMRDIDNGMEFHTGPHYDGSYELYVPDGNYEIMAGGMDWFSMDVDTILIDGDMIEHDIYLYPITFDASVEGYVYDSDGLPIPYAHVQIGNEGWGAGMETDEFGYFYFDLPVGFYYASAWADGFYMSYEQFSVNPGYNSFNFFLDQIQIDGAIAGTVYDDDTGAPIQDANVYAFSWDDDEGYWSYTDEDGEYWFGLPNGTYDVVVEHWEYPPMWAEGIVVNDDTSYVDFAMSLPDGGLDGYVYDDMGYPIWDAEVVIVSMLDSVGFFGYTDDDGYFSIPAWNGDYQIFAGAPGFEYGNFGMVTINNDWVSIDIYLQGREFAMPPEVNFIVDQPNDQGRWVRMQFWPGGTEWGPFHAYSVWRLTNTPMGPILDFVDYLPNHDMDVYNLVLPTLVDSSAHVSDPIDYMSSFMVTGHWDMYGYIDGMPGAGYSIDNIHPGIPGPLTLLSSTEDGVEIGWEMSMDDDFQYFEVYRASNPDFTDADVYPTVETMFSDGDVTIGQTYYYAVSAVDANGNISETSNVVTTSIVSVSDLGMIPSSFGLSQNYPNPFNPTTSIEFALPEASEVSLEIYNLLGQKVRTLVNGYVSAGYINTSWDGLDQNGKEISSGTYIYRLQTADQTFSKKMVLMK